MQQLIIGIKTYIFTILFILISLQTFAQTNTLPTNGNVGIGTTNPSALLDVNGNMIVDSSVVIKDSLNVQKKLIVDQDLKIKGEAVFVGEGKFKDKLVVDGLTKLNGDLKIKSLENTTLTTSRLLSILPNGKVEIANILLPPDDTYTCVTTMPWALGANNITDIGLCPNFNNVGIGTQSPTTKLHVAGNTLLNGRVGIGLTNISEINNGSDPELLIKVLPIYDKITLKMITPPGRGMFFIPKLNTESYSKMTVKDDVGMFWSDNNSENNDVGFVIAPYKSTAYSGIRINSRGEVGIGTPLVNNSKGYLLAVNGRIGAKEVEVEVTSNTWPDYVFNDDYDLKSLKEVKVFIRTNKHLPEIPNAEEVESEGLSLGEMNKLLLKKIEELTLYVIDLEERFEKLEKDNAQ